MKTEFLESFLKDVSKIKDASLKKSLRNTIERIELAPSLDNIGNVKKLKGFKGTFRLRIGDYRVGFFYDGKTISFAKFVHRKDIYKVFP